LLKFSLSPKSMKRCFAVVPAAGHSVRMGRPKLLLPVDGKPLIAHTLEAWLRSDVDAVHVVLRADDAALMGAVRACGAAAGNRLAIVVPTVPPPDMKASVAAAVDHIGHTLSPREDDAFLVAPADMPRLSTAIINRLVELHRRGVSRSILVPSVSAKRGHPVLFPWRFARDVRELADGEGLDAIVKRQDAVEVACDDLIAAAEAPFADIDTPDDFRRVAGGG
jgi:molybdenum cofactor cytidylyltransferase